MGKSRCVDIEEIKRVEEWRSANKLIKNITHLLHCNFRHFLCTLFPTPLPSYSFFFENCQGILQVWNHRFCFPRVGWTASMAGRCSFISALHLFSFRSSTFSGEASIKLPQLLVSLALLYLHGEPEIFTNPFLKRRHEFSWEFPVLDFFRPPPLLIQFAGDEQFILHCIIAVFSLGRGAEDGGEHNNKNCIESQ